MYTITFHWEYGNVREARYTPSDQGDKPFLPEVLRAAMAMAEEQVKTPLPAPSKVEIEQGFIV